MRIVTALFLAVGVPATAQQPPITFDANKVLPIASGEWSYVATAGGSIATYGNFIQLRCDKAARTMTIARPNAAPAALTVATDTLTRTLPPSGIMQAGDPLLDAIAFSRGRVIVSGGNAPAVAVPSWPEAARSIEDCRN